MLDLKIVTIKDLLNNKIRIAHWCNFPFNIYFKNRNTIQNLYVILHFHSFLIDQKNLYPIYMDIIIKIPMFDFIDLLT